MRRMRYLGSEPLIVRAAHSRAIQPNQMVDFDELVFAGNGAGYSLESALSDDAKYFVSESLVELEGGSPSDSTAQAAKSARRRR